MIGHIIFPLKIVEAGMKKNIFFPMLALITMLTSSCGEFDMPARDAGVIVQAAADTAICSGTYSNTISGVPVTINLTRNTDSLTDVTSVSGTMLYGNYTLGMGGGVDSSGNCFVWTWYNNLPSVGSGMLAGKVTETTDSGGSTTATFDFGGGQSTGGIYNQVVFPNMLKTASTGATSPPSASPATVSYAGTYAGSFLGDTSTIILTQTNDASGTALSGTLTLGQSNITLYVGGFVDVNNNAFVWAAFNNFTNFGSGVVAGKLTTTTIGGSITGTFDFGGGQSTGGIYNQIVLSDFTYSGSSTPVSYAGTYSGTMTFSNGGTGAVTLVIAQSGSTLTITVSSPYFSTVDIVGTVSGNTVTLIVPASSGCGGTANVSAQLSTTTLAISGSYPAINSGTCVLRAGNISGTFTKTT